MKVLGMLKAIADKKNPMFKEFASGGTIGGPLKKHFQIGILLLQDRLQTIDQLTLRLGN